MQEDTAQTQDEAQLNISTSNEVQAAWKEYTVLVDSGLFINGQEYPKGSKVLLPEATADNFKALKEVEDA